MGSSTHASKTATPDPIIPYVPEAGAAAHEEMRVRVGAIVGMAVGALVGADVRSHSGPNQPLLHTHCTVE